MSKRILVATIALAIIGSAAYASFGPTRQVHEFFTGHSHAEGHTIGAPEHSGGTDQYGCHNGSVPYHCHKRK